MRSPHGLVPSDPLGVETTVKAKSFEGDQLCQIRPSGKTPMSPPSPSSTRSPAPKLPLVNRKEPVPINEERVEPAYKDGKSKGHRTFNLQGILRSWGTP